MNEQGTATVVQDITNRLLETLEREVTTGKHKDAVVTVHLAVNNVDR